jgi:uncharacterized alpha-E superfamily protein
MLQRPPKTALQLAKQPAIIKPRSIPFQKRNPQTSLYLLRKQKERYANELLQLQQRQADLLIKIANIQKETHEIIEHWHKDMKEISQEMQYEVHTEERKQWKMKPMKY